MRKVRRLVTMTVVVSVGILGSFLATGAWSLGRLRAPAAPSLPPLLAAPGAGYLLEGGGSMSGYVRPAAVETAVGVPGLPPGIRAYARTWVREDLRSSVVEAAILTRSTGDAERAVAELLSACGARGGRPVGIARTTGMDAGGCEVDAILPPETAPGFYAVVARRRLAVLILVSAPGEPGARALGSQLAQATAAGVAPDPGTPGEAPLPDVFVLDSGFGSPLFDQKLGGLLIAGVLLVGLRVALNRWLLGMDRGCPDSLLSPLLQFLRR